MRKLIYAINLTLDGCCDHTKGLIPGEQLYDYYIALLKSADTFLYGRKTYQLMVPYWPDAAKKGDSKYAQAFIEIDNMVVISKNLDKAEGKNSKIIRTNLHGEITKLKQERGKNILTGGVDVPSQLIELGLVDEFHVVIQPVIVGEGRRLFDALKLQEKLQFKLIDSKVFETGHVALRYGKA